MWVCNKCDLDSFGYEYTASAPVYTHSLDEDFDEEVDLFDCIDFSDAEDIESEQKFVCYNCGQSGPRLRDIAVFRQVTQSSPA